MTNKTKPTKKKYLTDTNFERFFNKQSLEDRLMINDYLVKRDKHFLSQQAEHFVKLGEELRKKPDEEALRLRGMDRMSERYLSASVEAVKFHGYNQAISDFQEAIKKEKK